MGKCEHCIVRQLSALKALGKTELLKMAECKTSTVVRRGEAIFSEGDHINGIFCVREGVCKMTKLAPNGQNHIVRLAMHGELLGQRSVLSDEPANLSAIALEDMEVCFIPKTEILNFADENKKFSGELIKSLCSGLRDSDDELAHMAQSNARQRLAHTLLHLHAKFGTDTENAIKVRLSREELASLAGTVSETCIRLLSDFAKHHLIKLLGKKIVILDTAGLQGISQANGL